VARAVGDDELAFLGRVAVGDVDRDPLLALGLETVQEQREVDLAAGRPLLLAVARDRGELVLVDQLRVVQEPPDQGALPVVDRAAGEEPQELLVLVPVEVGLDVAQRQGLEHG
jgi:hypothetical protein